jgi:hypothetical protein
VNATAPTLASLRALGLRLHLDGDRLGVGPAHLVTPDLQAAIAAGKPALLAELAAEQAEDVAEFIQERAAICEFEGGLPRPEAEALAVHRASVRYSLHDLYGSPAHRGGGYLLGEPGDSAESLLAELRQRYGHRLAGAEAQEH